MKPFNRPIVLIILISVLSSLAVSGLSYIMLKKHNMTEAKIRSSILLDSVNASAVFFERNQKPLTAELFRNKGGFCPELTNGFMLLRESANLFKKKNDVLWLHLAAINPLHEENQADHYESRIIEAFNTNPQLKKKEGVLKKNGGIFYYNASPIKVSDDSCLNCHGKPENAPRSQIILYGMNNGYNWQKGKTAAAAIVYVPLENSFRDALSFAVTIFFTSLICFFLGFLVFFKFADQGRT